MSSCFFYKVDCDVIEGDPCSVTSASQVSLNSFSVLALSTKVCKTWLLYYVVYL